MRGLLQGSKRVEEERVYLREIRAPRFLPQPSNEDLFFLRDLELGKVKVPLVKVDQGMKLIVTEVKGVDSRKNIRNWQLVALTALSNIRIKMIQLNMDEQVANDRLINALERAYIVAAADNTPPQDEEELEPEPEEDDPFETPRGEWHPDHQARPLDPDLNFGALTTNQVLHILEQQREAQRMEAQAGELFRADLERDRGDEP